MAAQGIHDAVDVRPVEPSGGALPPDLAPGERLAHPDKPPVGHSRQRRGQLLVIVAIQRDVDSEGGHVGLAHRRWEAARHAPDARSMRGEESPHTRGDDQEQRQPDERADRGLQAAGAAWKGTSHPPQSYTQKRALTQGHHLLANGRQPAPEW